jgi:hypothetical protein
MRLAWREFKKSGPERALIYLEGQGEAKVDWLESAKQYMRRRKESNERQERKSAGSVVGG